jgi:hypothetical protein
MSVDDFSEPVPVPGDLEGFSGDYDPSEDPYDPSAPQPLFPGDTGRLTRRVRDVLVSILKRRYVSAELHPQEWQIIQAHQGVLTSALHDLYLELVVDRTYEVAYKRQAVSETGNKFPTLLYDREYNREETILLVHLRRLLRTHQQTGEDQVFVDKDTLVAEITSFRPATSTNQVEDEKKARNAIDSLTREGLLLAQGDEDRMRISPVVEAILPVERLRDLAGWLRSENNPDSDDDSPGDDIAENDPEIEALT